MAISAKEKKKYSKDDETVIVSATEKVEDGQLKSSEDSDLNHLRQLLLEAQKNAESAKATVAEVMTNIYSEKQTSKKNTGNLAEVSDEIIESAIQKAEGTKFVENCYENDSENSLYSITVGKTDTGKTGVLHRILGNGNGSLNVISEITRSVFFNKSIAPDSRKEFYNLMNKQSKQLRQLIDSVIEEQSRKKAEKIVERAKSEIAAAQIVVSQAQEEVDEAQKQAHAAREEARRAKGAAEEAMNAARKQIKDARYEIEKAHADTEEAIRLAQESVKQAEAESRAEKKTAEVIISQAKQENMSKMAEEIKAAKEEVKAAREAADNAIRQSADEIEKSRAEVKAAHNNAQVVAALAQEKVTKAAEEIEKIKKQTQIEIDQANAEAQKAKEDADISLKDSQRAKEEAEKSIKAAEEARAQAEEKAYSYFRAEINRVIEEVEIAKNEALEVIARSREESELTRSEAEAIKKASEEAVNHAQEGIRKAREEADLTKQAAMEEVAAMKEELRKSREDAEASILKANEAMTQASYDIVCQTREEIARTRQEIEMASLHPETILNRAEEPDTSSSISRKNDTHYIAAMLHEMRAPLHSISGFARLMLEDDVPNTMTRQEFLSILVQQSDTLNRLLDDLTGNLNTRTNHLEISRTIVSPNKLINDVIHSMRNAALAKNILIGSTVPDMLPAVEADESRLKRALINLVDNALKFNEGNSTVIIKTQVLENELVILVEDHGIGIPEGELQLVFDENYRASNHGDSEGQGLGLTICKQIVESHGGRVHAESIAGEGSTFSFTLPIMQS